MKIIEFTATATILNQERTVIVGKAVDGSFSLIVRSLDVDDAMLMVNLLTGTTVGIEAAAAPAVAAPPAAEKATKPTKFKSTAVVEAPALPVREQLAIPEAEVAEPVPPFAEATAEETVPPPTTKKKAIKVPSGASIMLPAEIKNTDKMRDLLLYLHDTVGLKTADDIVAACLTLKPDVPLLQKVPNVEDRVNRALVVLGLIEDSVAE